MRAEGIVPFKAAAREKGAADDLRGLRREYGDDEAEEEAEVRPRRRTPRAFARTGERPAAAGAERGVAALVARCPSTALGVVLCRRDPSGVEETDRETGLRTNLDALVGLERTSSSSASRRLRLAGEERMFGSTFSESDRSLETMRRFKVGLLVELEGARAGCVSEVLGVRSRERSGQYSPFCTFFT